MYIHASLLHNVSKRSYRKQICTPCYIVLIIYILTYFINNRKNTPWKSLFTSIYISLPLTYYNNEYGVRRNMFRELHTFIVINAIVIRLISMILPIRELNNLRKIFAIEFRRGRYAIRLNSIIPHLHIIFDVLQLN